MVLSAAHCKVIMHYNTTLSDDYFAVTYSVIIFCNVPYLCKIADASVVCVDTFEVREGVHTLGAYFSEIGSVNIEACMAVCLHVQYTSAFYINSKLK